MNNSCGFGPDDGSIERDGAHTGGRWSRHRRSPRIVRVGRQVSGAMSITRRARLLATAAILLIAIAGCSNENDPKTTPATSAPTSAAATTPPTPTENAADQATRLVHEYYAVTNKLRQDEKTPLSRLKSVAISTELTAQQHLLKRERRDGLHQTGETRISELTVQAVSLDNSDPKSGMVPVVQVDVCWDVSGVDVVDANGKSVVSDDRPDFGWVRHLVANYEWDSDPDGAWRIASSQDLKRTPCDA